MKRSVNSELAALCSTVTEDDCRTDRTHARHQHDRQFYARCCHYLQSLPQRPNSECLCIERNSVRGPRKNGCLCSARHHRGDRLSKQCYCELTHNFLNEHCSRTRSTNRHIRRKYMCHLSADSCSCEQLPTIVSNSENSANINPICTHYGQPLLNPLQIQSSQPAYNSNVELSSCICQPSANNNGPMICTCPNQQEIL